ncbi:hypothetical protein SCHPADRAFT_267308 [Schizopora paradoxa]|uniref:Uncharacterized protein n=1 Tax=Schizopora paradoxa TaxID=27342 RepID=A0A0H2RV25_9AGAM|nr:hypothetical protein SCHPADRAFT_267308 [Schizopora paradoxa]
MSDKVVDLDCILSVVRKLRESGLGLGGETSVEDAWNDFAYDAQIPVDVRIRNLSRMKSVLATLKSITKSLENHVERATENVVPEIRARGLASLPDELLARIFDFYYQDYLVKFYPRSDYSMNPPPRKVLPKVCKRFRRLAHHLPALWEIVRLGDGVDEIKLFKKKCESPRVCIQLSADTNANDVQNFLDTAHGHNHWEELHLDFEDDAWAVRIFEMMGPNISFDFSSLDSLSIISRGYDAEEAFIPSLFPKKCCEAFSEWQLYGLSSLFLTNIIPEPNVSLSDLEEISITLGCVEGMPEGIYEWDMRKLVDFIASLRSLQSLTIKFDAAETSNTNQNLLEVGRSCRLTKLSSLSMTIRGGTDPLVLKQFVDMVDMPKLKTLDLDIHWDQTHEPALYINALFKPSPSAVRTLPFVEKASLRIQHSGGKHYSGSTIFRALPKLSTLSLATPGFQLPYFSLFKDEFGCFEDLHTLRLDNCREHCPNHLVHSLPSDKRQSRTPLQKLHTLELVGCCGLLRVRDELRARLGDKLVWVI